MSDTERAAAQRLRQLLIDASPLIEEYTSSVCPACTDVCCRQKHGLFRERDFAYFRALGIGVPLRDATRQPEGACELMGPLGCRDPRWLRPFKCTWYFCEPILAALDAGPQKKARRLSALMQEMIGLYDALRPRTPP